MSAAHLPWLLTGSTLRPMILRVALGEFGLQTGHVAEFGGADGREVLGMGEQNRPAVADPLVEIDCALRGLDCEIGSFGIDS